MAPRRLTSDEAIERLGCSRTQLWRLRKDGRIRSTTIGTRRYYSQASIDRYLDSERERIAHELGEDENSTA